MTGMAAREAFTDLEWEALQFTPVAAFYAVAQADGFTSREESVAFMNRVTQMASLNVPQTRLAQEVFASLGDDRILRRFDEARANGLAFDNVFHAAKAALDTKAVPTEADAFRQVIRLLCVAVAESAPLVGLKVTDQEQAAIEAVVAALA
jgi:hypothetical protein